MIKVFHEAREVLEKVAAEFPELADWSIRSRSHALVGDRTVSGDPMTRSVKNVIESVRSLIQVLDQESPGDQGQTSHIEQLMKRSGELKNLAEPRARPCRPSRAILRSVRDRKLPMTGSCAT